MSQPPILSYPLKNGLNLLCLDQSKKVAADRWYVCIWVQMSIPVDKQWFVNNPVDEATFQQISRTLGKEVIIKLKKERHFVSDDQKEQIVKEICDRAVEMGKQYFVHDDFAARYMLKTFADQQRGG